MLTRIVQNSPQVGHFVAIITSQGGPPFSAPQRQPILEVIDAVVVCPEKKTLAALQRPYVETTEVSNWADCFRISPWPATDLRQGLGRLLIEWAVVPTGAREKPPVILISLDDSLSEKDKATRPFEGVDWPHDHLESPPKKPRFKNGRAYVVCAVRIGQIEVTCDLRIYLRQRTVRRLNRRRPPDQRLPFLSQMRLARQLLVSLQALLAKGGPV